MLGLMLEQQAPRNPSQALLVLRSAALTQLAEGSAKKFGQLKLSGIMLAVSGVISVAAVSALGAGDVADIIALRILAYACWLYGGLGMWALLSPAALKEDCQRLGRLRGTEIPAPLFRGVGIFRRLTRGLWIAGMPALVAALFASPSEDVFGQRLGLLLMAALYLLSLAALLGFIGGLAIRVSASRARRIAAAVIMGPFLLGLLFSFSFSLPSLYIWGLGQLIDWGGLVL